MIVSGWAFRKAWYDCLTEFEKIFTALNVGRVCIETNGIGDLAVIQMRKLGIPTVGRNTTTNKHQRIMNVASYVNDIKLSNKSDTSKLSISTQYSTKIDIRNEPDQLSEISDFELEPNEDSFHSSLNNSKIDSDQVVSFSDDFELIDDDEERIKNFSKLNNFKTSPIIKPLINVNSFQF